MRALVVAGLLVLAVAATACDGPRYRSGAKLELADAKLVVEQADGQLHVLALNAAGAVTFDNEPVITLEKTGHILIGGKRLARVEPDGSISANGMRTNVQVKEDGTFILSTIEELTFAPDGTASGPLFETMDHPRVKLEGGKVRYEGPPGARQATVVGFAAFLTDLPASVPTTK
jgi:hypothetical protein